MSASFPAKTDFVDGDVLSAAEMNQIGENLNDLDSRIVPSESPIGLILALGG